MRRAKEITRIDFDWKAVVPVYKFTCELHLRNMLLLFYHRASRPISSVRFRGTAAPHKHDLSTLCHVCTFRLHQRPPRTAIQITRLINIARRRVKLSRRDHTILSAGRCDYGNTWRLALPTCQRTAGIQRCWFCSAYHEEKMGRKNMHFGWAISRLNANRRQEREKNHWRSASMRETLRRPIDRPTNRTVSMRRHVKFFIFFIVRLYRLMLLINFRSFYCLLRPSFLRPIFICF